MTTVRLTAPKMIDPIAALVNRARDNAGAHPVALVSMDIGITLTGGLAAVETKRTFRNNEASAIEALLSLPVPVHAAFFGHDMRVVEPAPLADHRGAHAVLKPAGSHGLTGMVIPADTATETDRVS